MSNTIAKGRSSPTSVSDTPGKQKPLKSEFTFEIPAGKYQNQAGVFKLLTLLGYATSTFELHPVKDTDITLAHPNEYPKGDDIEGWDKYLFSMKRIRRSGKEYDVTHVVITASQRLVATKRNKRVWDTLTRENIFIRAREFTNYSEKTAIGWFAGINTTMTGKDNLTNAIRTLLEERANIVDTEIVLETSRITQYIPGSKTVTNTEAWMLYGNKAYIDEIEECINNYLSDKPANIALGLRHSIFVPASRTKTELPIKVLRIRDHNRIISKMASVKVNNVYYKTDIHYNEKIQDLFDHLSEGDRDGESASFRVLLDEHLQHFMDSCDNQHNTDDTIEEEMDYYDGVYDIYFK